MMVWTLRCAIACVCSLALPLDPSLAQDEQRQAQPERVLLEDDPAVLIQALRRPGSSERRAALQALAAQPKAWKQRLVEFIRSGKVDSTQQTEAIVCLARYRDPGLLSFYAEHLRDRIAGTGKLNVLAERQVAALIEALVLAGSAEEIEPALIASAVRRLIELAPTRTAERITERNGWAVAVGTLRAGNERVKAESTPLEDEVRQAVVRDITARVSMDPRYTGHCTPYHAAVLFTCELRRRVDSGESTLAACLGIFETSPEHSVRAAAMNVARKLVDSEASGVDATSLSFPLVTDWERDRAIQIARDVLSNIGVGMFKIPPGSVTLSDGRPAKQALTGDALERELAARRTRLREQYDTWPQVRARLVMRNDVDLARLVGSFEGPLLLVHDQRLQRPIVAERH